MSKRLDMTHNTSASGSALYSQCLLILPSGHHFWYCVRMHQECLTNNIQPHSVVVITLSSAMCRRLLLGISIQISCTNVWSKSQHRGIHDDLVASSQCCYSEVYDDLEASSQCCYSEVYHRKSDIQHAVVEE